MEATEYTLFHFSDKFDKMTDGFDKRPKKACIRIQFFLLH